MPADLQKLLDRLAKVGERTSDAKAKAQISGLVRQLREGLQKMENERNELKAQVSQHAASKAALASNVPPAPANGGTTTAATPLDLAKSFRNVIDAIQTEARQSQGVATTIKDMDIEIRGLVQVNDDKTTTFVLPNAGSPIDANSLSTLRVSFGAIPVAAPAPPATVTVPDVRQKSVTDALAILQTVGLVAGTISQQTAAAPAVPGTVISQDPAANTSVAPGTPVNLVVAMSGTLVSVPNVVGLSLARASATITASGLRLGSVNTVPSSPPFDTVRQQSPPASTQVVPGTAVSLTLGERINI